MYITGNIQYRVASMLDFVGVILQLALQRSQGYSWPSSGCDCFKFGQTREGGHNAFNQLSTPGSPDESEDEHVRIYCVLTYVCHSGQTFQSCEAF